MRVLVQCPSCRRQSDAGDLGIGSKFHCPCGEVLKVPNVQVKDAAVVRCSSCGGPRTDGAKACRFCGAEFTLHERDLHTICPSCMARIMDRAKFCHNCGTAIMVQGKSGTDTELPCPACGSEQKLTSRMLGEPPLAVLECQTCAGLWVGRETFELLTTRMKDKEIASTAPGGGGSARPKRSLKQSGPLYRRCPHCNKMMARRNYAKMSGVIIDNCHEHGIWFDAGELHALLQWIRNGGPGKARQQAQRPAKVRKFPSKLDRMAKQGGHAPFRAQPFSKESSPLAELLSVLFTRVGS